MEYSIGLVPSCKKAINKLCTKNTKLKATLKKKIMRIQANPYHFKPLRKPMQNMRRAHILNCFVLTYEIVEEQKVVRLLKFSHHDDAY